MSEQKHSPGPWHWVPCNHGDSSMPKLIASDGTEVCNFGNYEMYYPTEGSDPGQEDAALIAAAPDLLAACEEMIECLADIDSKAIRSKMAEWSNAIAKASSP